MLLSGVSGFLGKYIKTLYSNPVDTIGRSIEDTYFFDFSNPHEIAIDKVYNQVVHCAGLAHEKGQAAEADLFDKINVQGTKAFLNSLEQALPEQFVFISSVAVYGLSSGKGTNEETKLKSLDPYGSSKIEAETIVLEWGEKHNVKVLILRLPLIAGKNPPGNLGKIISGISSGHYFSVGGGKARRSMVMAEDVAKVIFQSSNKGGIYNLSDGYHPSFREIEACIATQLNKPLPRAIPGGLARLIGKAGDLIPGAPVNSATIQKMINDLTFDDYKARKELNWSPRKVIDHFKIK